MNKGNNGYNCETDLGLVYLPTNNRKNIKLAQNCVYNRFFFYTVADYWLSSNSHLYSSGGETHLKGP